ncbi:MAG: ABC transporter ATP-binding protein [Paludibacteraceae bacterium]|nr:ABC transporter ATP-binding protein [Paludibacteraceae bacterium]
MSSVSISTNKLTIGYKVQSTEYSVQTDLDFSLHKGEMVCMLGPNGCGKSTLLRTLAGLQPPLEGEYRIQNTEYRPEKSVALVLTERLSMDNTTVHDVVAMGRYPYTSFLGGLTEEDERIITESLQQVGFHSPVTCHLSSFFNAHSDGEKQRILIAKALAQQTPIILLDEPTAHLDLPHRILILRLLRQLAHEQGKTVLISTHELDLALALSDRILLMSPHAQGVQLDTAENLKKANAFTSAFGMDIFNPLG